MICYESHVISNQKLNYQLRNIYNGESKTKVCVAQQFPRPTERMMKAMAASAINRAKAISASLRIFNSSLATHNQVSRFSPFTPFSPSSPFHHLPRPITHQKLHFSTKPNSIADLILTNDWSQDLEHELVKCSPSLTHETVISVLKRIDKNPEKAYSFFNWVVEKEWFCASSSVFSLIVRVLANKETMKQFWITLRKMKEKGFYLDEETYLTISIGFKKAKLDSDAVALKHFFEGMLKQNAMEGVVTKVVDIILGSEWDHKVESELSKVKIQLSDNFVVRVLNALRNHPMKAYKFFNWVGKQSGYQQNTVTYNAIARVLAGSGWIAMFRSIIAEMKNVRHELDIDTYIMISMQLRKTEMVKDAVRLYELMMEPSVQDCIFLLKNISASYRPDLDLVFRAANKFEATGHTLPSLSKAMINAGYEPDNITYCKLVFGLCKMRRLEEAYEALEEMESCGFIPNIKTWTMLITEHCDTGEVDQALLCFSKMLEKGTNADADLLDVLVEGLLTQKRMDGAYKLLLKITSKCRISPRKDTYMKMIEKLLGVRKFEEALHLLRSMKNHDYRPHHEPFNELFESLLRIRKFDEALDLFRLMRKHKYPLFECPFLFAFYVSKSGTVDDAVKYLKAWSKEHPVSHSAYLWFFESFNEEGRVLEAKELLCKCPSRIRNRKKILEYFASVENRMAASRV